LNRRRERAELGLDDEVVVRGHEDPRVDRPTPTAGDASQPHDECGAVEVVHDDDLVGRAASRCGVEETVVQLGARPAGHAATVPRQAPVLAIREQIGTVLFGRVLVPVTQP